MMPSSLKSKGSLIAALDIGSSKIACFIARILDEEGGLEIVGVGHQAASGIKGGAITDLAAAEQAIRQAVHAAENMAASTMKGYPLREVVVNVPGIHARSSLHAVDVNIHGEEVTDNDVRRALSKAQDAALRDDSELVHTIPIGFRIDGHGGIREPRGMYGQTMEVETHIVTGNVSALRNIATCIEHSHLDIAALCAAPYAAGLASLVEDEMDLGATLIDIGGGVTSMAVFQGGSLLFSDSFALGGRHVTSDIARGLTTGLNDAERLKTLYGSAMATSTDDSEMIDVPPLGEAGQSEPNHIPRSRMIGIIQPRMEEILEQARSRLADSGVGPALGRRVVLTGGGAQLAGVRDLAQIVLDKQVRVGRPLRLNGLPDSVSGPAFATTAGLLTYVSSRAHEMPGEIAAGVEPGSVWERVKHWLRENW